MHLTRIKLGGVPPFTQPIVLRFDERVNVFIGPNASGKSTILLMLADSLIGPEDNIKRPSSTSVEFSFWEDKKFDELVGRNSGENFLFASEDWPRNLTGPDYDSDPDYNYVPVFDSDPDLSDGPDLSDEDSASYIYERSMDEFDRGYGLSKYDVDKEDERLVDSVESEQRNIRYGPIINPDDLPVIHISSVREGLPGINDIDGIDAYGNEAAGVLAGPFSGFRTICASYLLEKELGSTESGCASRLLEKELGSTESAEIMRVARDIWEKACEMAGTCSKKICDEVIRDPRSHSYIPRSDERVRNPKIELPQMGIDTRDTRSFDYLPPLEQPSRSAYEEGKESLPIYLGHLSSGTEGTLLWILWLALQMVYFYKFEEGWEQKPAILLIDEIENHLHPTWQRRVIPALLEHFPGLQIFATTHSPFVVAGLKRGQIHRLYRESGVIKTPRLTDEEKQEQIVGWTIEEILQEFMEVDDPTDDATAEAAATLRWLRYRPPHGETAEDWRKAQIALLESNPETTRDEKSTLRWLLKQGVLRGDAETWWASTIERLRSLVSRDIEAGGPLAAQRELFMEQLGRLFAEDIDSSGSQEVGDEEA